ncbi:MAG: radical SAM protein [Clostridia bacterium]
MKTHKNIPIFIPHEGCKNNCIFCSQTKITGVACSEKTILAEVENVKKIVAESLDTIDGSYNEIAFFGGSFTGIERERMIALLDAASRFIGAKISGIRLSTRPDYIDSEICEILKNYGVTAVELGIQSTNDDVLCANKRGHLSCAGEKASLLIKKSGFSLTGQMMTGMYTSSPSDEIKTAIDIVSYGADSARIYPTVVFASTPLYELTIAGKYVPMTIDEAITRTADCTQIFIDSNVKLLRIGLHSSENLKEAPFGANHPALGELVEGEIYFKKICDLLKTKKIGENITVYAPKGEISKAVGQKQKNKQRLIKEFGLKRLIFRECDTLEKYVVRVKDN